MTDLAQQIRDRLDALGPERGMAVEFPAATDPADADRWCDAFLAAGGVPWTIQILGGGQKVYPTFELMRDVLLAVLELHAFPDGSGIPGEVHCGELIDWVQGGCPTVRLIAEKLGIEVADA